jgi:RNA polymerase sigma-70 factor (ECF subfamily)
MMPAKLSKQKHPSARAKESFERLGEPLRSELKLHCYRMLGSMHEVEGLVQETYLRAWRNHESEGYAAEYGATAMAARYGRTSKASQ